MVTEALSANHSSRSPLPEARRNLIQGQARAWQVLDPQVLTLLERLPRTPFMPAVHKRLADADAMLPLAHGELMLRPSLEARIVQELTIKPTDHVLEVGTGCGYLTALLALSASENTVHSVEWHEDIHAHALECLRRQGINNASLYQGDAHAGWSAQAPYDVIVITGALASADFLNPFFEQLRSGGRLFAVCGDRRPMRAILAVRLSDQAIRQDTLFETWLPPLHEAEPKPAFCF